MNDEINEYSRKIIDELANEKFSWHKILKMFELYALVR